jgi:hypothetical protein
VEFSVGLEAEGTSYVKRNETKASERANETKQNERFIFSRFNFSQSRPSESTPLPFLRPPNRTESYTAIDSTRLT